MPQKGRSILRNKYHLPASLREALHVLFTCTDRGVDIREITDVRDDGPFDVNGWIWTIRGRGASYRVYGETKPYTPHRHHIVRAIWITYINDDYPEKNGLQEIIYEDVVS